MQRQAHFKCQRQIHRVGGRRGEKEKKSEQERERERESWTVLPHPTVTLNICSLSHCSSMLEKKCARHQPTETNSLILSPTQRHRRERCSSYFVPLVLSLSPSPLLSLCLFFFISLQFSSQRERNSLHLFALLFFLSSCDVKSLASLSLWQAHSRLINSPFLTESYRVHGQNRLAFASSLSFFFLLSLRRSVSPFFFQCAWE